MKTLDMFNDQLELGQVKTITSNSGKTVDYMELLCSPTTKVQFAPSKDNKHIKLSFTDVNLDIPHYDCEMERSTLHNLIFGLKTMYLQTSQEE